MSNTQRKQNALSPDGGATLILTYHSISDHAGPTSISPQTFQMHIEALVASGYQAITAENLLSSRGGAARGGREVLITFDDGYSNFATDAVPVLVRHAMPSLVFIPTGKVGGSEDWVGAHADSRKLMSWQEIVDLADAGVEFGAHGVTHRDLTRLPTWELESEVQGSAETIAERLGYRPRTFAAPYGAVDARVISAISRHFDLGFGVDMGLEGPSHSNFDMPRIDMHYFRSPARWSDFLEGARAYFELRRGLRSIRSALHNVTRAVDR